MYDNCKIVKASEYKNMLPYMEAVDILLEGDTTVTESNKAYKIKEALNILTEDSSPVGRKLTEKLYQSVLDKAHIDFDDIPKSVGNIHNYSGYTKMCDTLSVIKQLAEEDKNKEVLVYVKIVEDAIRNISDLSATYSKGFTSKKAYVALEYDTYVYTCVQATSALIYSFVDYVKEPNTQVYSIKLTNTKLRADKFYFEQLARFNKVISKDGTQYRKMLEEMINGNRNARKNLLSSQINQIDKNNNNSSNGDFKPKTHIIKKNEKKIPQNSNNNSNINNNYNNNDSINNKNNSNNVNNNNNNINNNNNNINNNNNNINNNSNRNNNNIKNSKHNSQNRENKIQGLDKDKKYRLDDQTKKQKNEEEENIKDKLSCFRCYGKIIGASMCTKCQKVACGKCAEIMLQKKKCDYCKNFLNKEDYILIPFLNDLALFFIANKEKKEFTNKDNNLNDSFDESLNEKNQICQKHPGRYIEYICFNCNEFFCSECASFLNQENAQKHYDHLILQLNKLEEFNLKKIFEEHKILPETKRKIENILSKTKVNIRELEIRKKRENEIFESIKNNIELDYSQKIQKLKEKLTILKIQKDKINNYLVDNKYKFNEIENFASDAKVKLLKELNSISLSSNEIETIGDFKKGLCIETFESENIEIFLSNGEKYIEELKILDKDLYFIPNTKCQFNSQYLGGKIHFNLTFDLNEDLYASHLFKFYGHIILQNKNNCEYAVFNEYHLKNTQILTVEFEFKNILPLLDENRKFNIVIFITRQFYK